MKKNTGTLTNRKQYRKGRLLESDVLVNPFEQFDIWLNAAYRAGIDEPNAMSLSTVGHDNRPSSRIVLLRGADASGLAFFTNYLSRKGREISANSYGALLFFWKELERQLRVEGKILKVTASVSDAYFQSRPRASQISAAVSLQSAVVASRQVLEEMAAEHEKKFKNTKITRPRSWGGYLLKPDYFEFWQGGRDRLHDRIIYEKNKKRWNISRLAP